MTLGHVAFEGKIMGEDHVAHSPMVNADDVAMVLSAQNTPEAMLPRSFCTLYVPTVTLGHVALAGVFHWDGHVAQYPMESA